MKITKQDIFFFLGLAIPAVIAFRAFFLPGPLAWGDAPFFYPEAAVQLIDQLPAWVSTGGSFGGVNNFFWIYPLMVLYGWLASFLGNDIAIRVIFYFPAVLLSIVTPVIFAKYLGYDKIVWFFASLIYGLNTYFLLLIDGGQVGVALAYGIFPLALVFLHKLVEKPTPGQFFQTITVFMLLTMADIRASLIATFSLIVLKVAERLGGQKDLYKLKALVPFFLLILGLSSYWVFPTVKLLVGGLPASISDLELVSILDSLLLFQPHWPANEFGKIAPPPFYFVGILPLLFVGLFVSPNRKVAVAATIFLLFVFLAKGKAAPFGQPLWWLVNNIPGGFVFRDTTKFFAPLALFGGLLVGFTVFQAKRLVGGIRLFGPLALLIWGYLMFLILPAFLGELDGVLKPRTIPEELLVIKNKLAVQEGFFRTAWFPERHPLAFQTERHPALDGNHLVVLRPFAALNAGTFDLSNFFHQKQSVDWLALLGIKYLFFPQDPRKSTIAPEEDEDNKMLLSAIERLPHVEKVEWSSIPAFEVKGIGPRFFSFDKVIFVVGPDDIYERAGVVNGQLELASQGFVFLEDGLASPGNIGEIPTSAAVLVFNQKSETDLAAAFLQHRFLSPEQAIETQWAIRKKGDYLQWKYELLTNGINTREFDYQKGIAFSTQRGEKLVFNLMAAERGDYFILVRTLVGDGGGLAYSFLDKSGTLGSNKPNVFSWNLIDVGNLEGGSYRFEAKNLSGVSVVNTVALVPKSEWDDVVEFVDKLTRHFTSIQLGSDEGEEFAKLVASTGNWVPIEYEQVNPARYQLTLSAKRWVAFADSYHHRWRMQKGGEKLVSMPLYSAINGFFVPYPWTSAQVVFGGQEDVRWGTYFSLLSILFGLAVFFWRTNR